jgi:hypothetical protein
MCNFVLKMKRYGMGKIMFMKLVRIPLLKDFFVILMPQTETLILLCVQGFTNPETLSSRGVLAFTTSKESSIGLFSYSLSAVFD